MKAFPAQLAYLLGRRPTRRNVAQLLKLLALLLVMVTVFSITFHFLMEYEGRAEEFSWFTGFYWTLTVMSTLGFGDITFHSDLGRAFAMVVLITGVTFLLVIFPFTFIRFFYAPWLEAQQESRAPRQLPEDMRGHVILTEHEAVADALVQKLTQYRMPYVFVVPTVDEALRLHDEGFEVLVGAVDSPETHHRARVEQAALVAATGDDEANTNVAFTVRELSAQVPIITIAARAASVDILELAGSTHVLHLGEMLGQALARRADGSDAVAHLIGQFDELVIAEAAVGRTPLVGLSIKDCGLREDFGITIAGLWERGRLEAARPETTLTEHTVLILAGSREQLETFNGHFLAHRARPMDGPVLVIGGGRVGAAAAALLDRRGIPCRVVEREADHCPLGDPRFLHGDAAELEVLQRAGIMDAPTVIITTHDDDANIYLAIYCRRLRPDMQIVCRATHERNVATLHRAGADFVLSYASLGANAIFNFLSRSDVLMVAEGLSLLRVETPPTLAGRTVAGSAIRKRTGCSVVAIRHDDETTVNPPPDAVISAGSELILIGTVEGEDEFLRCFVDAPRGRGTTRRPPGPAERPGPDDVMDAV